MSKNQKIREGVRFLTRADKVVIRRDGYNES